MRRNIKIIIIVLVVIVLFLLGAWLFARNKATKNNSNPPTFKSFLGIGGSKKTQNNDTVGNVNTSDFTTDQSGVKTNTNSSATNSSSVRKSVFTNAGLNPIVNEDGVVIQEDGGSQNNNGGTSGVIPPGGVTPVVVTTPTTSAPECSDADLSIEFTAEEIARLNILKSKFFTLAQSLNTDNDLATEISNYDLFKSKSDKLTELNNYCRQSPVYTSARSTVSAPQNYGTVVAGPNSGINYRVPTPFWHETTKDNQAFIHQGVNWKGIFSDPDLVFPERSIEHALRLNLW